MIPAFFPSPLLKSTKMIDVLRDLNLTTNLKLCLDAGDSDSYSGSGQTWTDVSGGGYNFYRGATSGAEGSDPTFNGTAGRLSVNEYFSLDGGDWFTYSAAIPSWVSDLHKNNAVFTIIAWTYANNVTNGATQMYSAINTGGVSNSGIYFGNPAGTPARAINLHVDNTSGTVLNATSSIAGNNNAWNMMSASFTESAGTLLFGINSSYESQTGKTYSSPGTDATPSFSVGHLFDGTNENAGDRFGAVAILSQALSQAELTGVFTGMRGRFGV